MANPNQTNLFGEREETKPSTSTGMVKSLNVEPRPDDDPGLRRLKKNFNHRLKAIAKLKEEIEELPKVFGALNDQYNKIVQPTEERLLTGKLALIETIDDTYAKKSFSNRDRDYICSLMVEELNTISEMGYEYDTKFERYFELDDLEDSKDLIEEMISEMMGIDIDVEDMIGKEKLSAEEFEEKYGEKIKEEAEAFEQEQNNNSRKQQNKKKNEGDEPDYNLHFMKTYKSLAKKIHPDLEQDPVLRKEKEKLMQELAHAKDGRDLFQLIAIKLKIEKNEVVLDETYLKFYAGQLLEQKKNLKQDIYILKNQSGVNSWLYQKFHARHRKTTMKRFATYRDSLENEIEQCEQFTQSIKTVKGMKQYIRDIQEVEDKELLYDLW